MLLQLTIAKYYCSLFMHCNFLSEEHSYSKDYPLLSSHYPFRQRGIMLNA